MKKIFSVALVLIVLFQMTSCFKQKPSKTFSKEFQDHFFENYTVVDPCISYFEANEANAMLPIVRSTQPAYRSMSRIEFAKIKEVDDLSFVAVIEYQFFFTLSRYTLSVYQTKDAPVPMRDWQIKQVYLSDYSFHGIDIQREYQKPHNRQLSEDNLCAVFEAGKDDLLTNAIGEAYRNASPLTKMPRGVNIMGSDFNYSFHFVVQFEECPNICWNTQICYQNGKYYISVMNERDENDPSKWVEKYGELDERIYPMIVPFFEEKGWEGKDWGEE